MEIDRNQLSCLNSECSEYGKFGAGNIGIHSCASKIYYCNVCKGRWSVRRNTIFYNLKTDEEKVLLALKMLSERNSARATGRTLGFKEDTILDWLKKAARHAREVSDLLITRLNVTQLQLDELWSFVGKKRCRQKCA